MKKGGRLKNAGKNLTGTADFHLFAPVLVNVAVTDCAVDKPAKASALKLPGRTLSLLIGSTFFYPPAWFVAVWVAGFP